MLHDCMIRAATQNSRPAASSLPKEEFELHKGQFRSPSDLKDIRLPCEWKLFAEAGLWLILENELCTNNNYHQATPHSKFI